MKITIKAADGSKLNYDNVVKFEMLDIVDSYIRVYYYDNASENAHIRKEFVKYNNVTDIEVNELCCTETIM